MAKVVNAVVGGKRFYEFADQPPEFLHGALGTFAQRAFEFRECHLNWVEVWQVWREINEVHTHQIINSEQLIETEPTVLLQSLAIHLNDEY